MASNRIGNDTVGIDLPQLGIELVRFEHSGIRPGGNCQGRILPSGNGQGALIPGGN